VKFVAEDFFCRINFALSSGAVCDADRESRLSVPTDKEGCGFYPYDAKLPSVANLPLNRKPEYSRAILSHKSKLLLSVGVRISFLIQTRNKPEISGPLVSSHFSHETQDVGLHLSFYKARRPISNEPIQLQIKFRK
jgi:hypothetical protein